MKSRFFIKGLCVLTTVLFLTGCLDNSSYPKVAETLIIYNNTDSTIYIEYGFLKSISPAGHVRRDSVPKSMSSFFQFNDSMITNLWISEKDFNIYVSQLKIYRLENRDSIFVAARYYNTKSAWDYHFNNNNYMKENQNELNIYPEMFIK